MNEDLCEHQSLESWMGNTFLTLADLWPAYPKAVVVGINPTPRSVAAGHYYQGAYGKRFFARLRSVGILPTLQPTIAG